MATLASRHSDLASGREDRTEALWRLGNFDGKRVKRQRCGAGGLTRRQGPFPFVTLRRRQFGSRFHRIDGTTRHPASGLEQSRRARDAGFGVFGLKSSQSVIECEITVRRGTSAGSRTLDLLITVV